jgi:tetratricopeptide (TPR) repeat protein
MRGEESLPAASSLQHEGLVRGEGMRTIVCRIVTLLVLVALNGAAGAATMPDVRKGTISPESKAQAEAYFRFMRGQLLEHEGEFDDALREYEKAFRLDPRSADIAIALSSLSLRLGKLDQALDYARKAVEQDPKKTQALLALAGIYAGRKQYDEAISLYRQAIAADPALEDAYLYLGTLYASLKRYGEAEEMLRKLQKINPQSLMAPYYLGRMFAEQQKYDSALAEFRKAAEIHDDFEPAYTGMGFVYEVTGRTPEAIEAYKRAIVANPHNLETRQRLAQLYIQENALDDALATLEGLVALDPQSYDAFVKIGLIQVDKKEYQRAVGAFRSALEGMPKDLRVRHYLGSTLLALGALDEALAEYQAILAVAPDDLDAILQSAYIQAKKEKPAEAISLLERAIKRQPGKADLYLYLSSAYSQTEEFERAADALKKGIAMAPDRDDLLFNLAVVYEKQGKRPEMIDALRKTLAVNADNVDALNYLGYSYAEKGENLDEALRLIQRAVALKPKSGYILDSLAWAYYQKGMYRDAAKSIEESIMFTPDDPVIRDHAGDIYLKLANRKKAKGHWLESLSLDPHNEALRKKFTSNGFGDPDTELKRMKPRERKKGKKK